jgi:hypothetical protein
MIYVKWLLILNMYASLTFQSRRERERVQKESKRVKAKKNVGGEVRDFISGGGGGGERASYS